MRFFKFIVICVLCICVVVAHAETKRAFLVGISDYGNPPGREYDPRRPNNIHGASDVELLLPLLEIQGFQVSSLVNKDATYNAIVLGLKRLSGQCKKGDIVYLHFSMHGQPIEDDNGDEPDGWDEALIPYDAWTTYTKGIYEGENHLRDDLLRELVDGIREKVGSLGQVYVVLDACHSGSSLRDGDNDDECFVRGMNVGFSSSIEKLWVPDKAKTGSVHLKVSDGFAPVAYIEACQSYQQNNELPDKKCGSLSYCIGLYLKQGDIAKDSKWIAYVKEQMETNPEVKRYTHRNPNRTKRFWQDVVTEEIK